MTDSDGDTQETECAYTETYFRIIQSIPSPKAEPYKQWLAKVGYERIQEIENPELIFTMLGEAGTRIEALKADAQGFDENKEAALKGGTAAGKALAAFEASIGKIKRQKSPDRLECGISSTM